MSNEKKASGTLNEELKEAWENRDTSESPDKEEAPSAEDKKDGRVWYKKKRYIFGAIVALVALGVLIYKGGSSDLTPEDIANLSSIGK